MEAKELQNKSIFDFTKDAALIEKAVGIDATDKAEVAYYLNTCHPVNLPLGIYEYALLVGDDELAEAAFSLHKSLFNEWQKEVEAKEAGSPDLLID